jgi:hypothetical protein
VLLAGFILLPCHVLLYVYIYDAANIYIVAVQAAAPKPKPKVEDGIFGTSGGIGFTKENELFVGRVAMLGFAVSSQKHCICIWSVFMHTGRNYSVPPKL